MLLERDINIAVNGPFLVRNLHQENRLFTTMLISCSTGTCLIKALILIEDKCSGKLCEVTVPERRGEFKILQTLFIDGP